VHLVLARLPDAPKGVKGISLFVVPKFLPREDGTPGARNGLLCTKVEEKMGIHGNATCVMNYDGATGWLVGEPNKGLKAMFTMMNEARILVAMQGLDRRKWPIRTPLPTRRTACRAEPRPARPTPRGRRIRSSSTPTSAAR
jgi:hypothetical protein